MSYPVKLPMAPQCKLYAWRSIHDPSVPAHFCHATNGECKPIQAGPDCTACPSFVAAPARGIPAPPPKAEAEPCIHLGEPTGDLVPCKSCKGTQLKVFECAIHGRCVQGDKQSELANCGGCRYRTTQKEYLTPERTIKFDLAEHFNAGLIEFQGRLLLATRYGWVGSRVFLHELDDELRVAWSRDLRIRHPQAISGAEDPRLFVYQGKLHVAVTGYERVRTPRTSQLVARLSDHLHVEEVWAPEYADRQPWEKNWQFFEHNSRLLCVYSVRPHVILEVGAMATPVATMPHKFTLTSAMRGGAPPVRVGDEWYHWFHTVAKEKEFYTYGLGLYTFGDDFAIRRHVPRVIMTASERVPGWNKSVVFPCGAALRGGKWLVSYGYHDRESRIAIFDAAQVERQLRAL
jgi:predicted GH43/DUF377 family glycosyl hydrolase